MLLNNAAKIVLVALLLNLCVSLARAQQSGRATLAWKFASGDAFSVDFEQNQTVLTRIEERDRTLESQLILGVQWKVLDVAGDGTATIEQTIQRVRIKTGTLGAELKKVIDVDTSADVPLRGISRDAIKQVQPLVGLKFNLVMSPSGKVVELSAGDEVAATISKLPETSAIRNAFSTKAILKIIENSSMVLSNKELGEGDTWDDDSEVVMKANDGRTYKFERKMVSTLESIDADTAKIGVTVSMSPSGDAEDGTGTELTSPMELLSFESGGSTQFDRKSGTITSSTMDSELKTRAMYRTDQINTTLRTKSKTTVTRTTSVTGK